MMHSTKAVKQAMSEREIAYQRVLEKEKLSKAWRDMTRLFISASSLIFLTLLSVWAIQHLPTIEVPTVYKWNVLVVALSSLFGVLAQRSISNDDLSMAFKYTGWTMIFGIVFLMVQLIGWQELYENNHSFRNILLPFALVHILHVTIGLGLLGRVFLKLTAHQVHSKEMMLAKNAFRFWHFLGVVWLLVILIS